MGESAADHCLVTEHMCYAQEHSLGEAAPSRSVLQRVPSSLQLQWRRLVANHVCGGPHLSHACMHSTQLRIGSLQNPRIHSTRGNACKCIRACIHSIKNCPADRAGLLTCHFCICYWSPALLVGAKPTPTYTPMVLQPDFGISTAPSHTCRTQSWL